MTLPKSIKELRNPDTLKSGHIAKMSKGRLVVVKRNKSGKASYRKASKTDIKCSKTLKRNVKQMLNEVKSKKNKRVKTYPQALAIAYSKTQKSYPRCELVKRTKSKSKPNSKRTSKRTNKRKMMGGKRLTHKVQTGAGKKRVKLQRNILKLLIKKGYILKQDGTCSTVKSGKIKSLYNKDITDNTIKKIRNKDKGGKMNFTDFLNKMNVMIVKCASSSNIKKNSHPIISPQLSSHYISGFRYSGSYKNISYDSNEIRPEFKDRVKMSKLYEFVKTLP